MSIERYDRSNRNPFNDNVNVIDHISYCMDAKGEEAWFDFIYKSIPPTSSQFRKPHLTVAYSPTEIMDFPKMDFEGELYYTLSEKDAIVLPILHTGYRIYIDPFHNRHLVLSTPIDQLFIKHQYYLTRGASWLHGTYDPFIIIETNTLHNDSSIRDIPLPNREYIFNVLRFCRFGEVSRE